MNPQALRVNEDRPAAASLHVVNMPKPATLRRRAQRLRAREWKLRAPLPPGFLDEVNNVMRDLYLEPLREMLNKESVFLQFLDNKQVGGFAGDYFTRVPFSLQVSEEAA